MPRKKQQGYYQTEPLVAAKAVKGFSDARLAEATGKSQITIRQVLRGTAKKFDAVAATAKALGLSMSVVIEGDK